MYGGGGQGKERRHILYTILSIYRNAMTTTLQAYLHNNEEAILLKIHASLLLLHVIFTIVLLTKYIHPHGVLKPQKLLKNVLEKIMHFRYLLSVLKLKSRSLGTFRWADQSSTTRKPGRLSVQYTSPVWVCWGTERSTFLGYVSCNPDYTYLE